MRRVPAAFVVVGIKPGGRERYLGAQAIGGFITSSHISMELMLRNVSPRKAFSQKKSERAKYMPNLTL